MQKSKLVMTLLVRDEADIIKQNIDFHLSKGVDFIIATDNGSEDGTRDILLGYKEKGVLYLIDETTHDHNQADWLNRMGQIAVEEFNAGIIFHCDADEFWYPRSGNLRTEILARQEDVLSVGVINMAITDRDESERFPEDTRFAVVRPYEVKDYEADTKNNNFYLFYYPPKVIYKTAKGHLEVASGNHSIMNKKDVIAEGLAQDIIIFHYPLRGRKHFFLKVTNMGSAFEKNTLVDKHTGFHVRRWYESYKRGTLDEDYKRVVLNNNEIARFLHEGRIEEMCFEEIVLGLRKANETWHFFNRHFEHGDVSDLYRSDWYGHIFFSYDLVRNLKPRKVVELGTYNGYSFFSFCQAVKDGWLDTELYAVDTWKGDNHTGFYDESVFENVGRIRKDIYGGLKIFLLRKTFDEAIDDFDDESIDILHIDGYHTYEAVKHDFESWLGKVKQNGIVLLHDTAETRADFGVYKLWDDLKKEYDTLEFHHSHGLGVLFKKPGGISRFFDFPLIWQNYYALMMKCGSLETINRIREKEIDNLKIALQQRDWEVEYMKSSKFWKIRSWYMLAKQMLTSFFKKANCSF